MSLHLIALALSLAAGAFVFGGTVVIMYRQMPTPHMRARRTGMVAHR